VAKKIETKYTNDVGVMKQQKPTSNCDEHTMETPTFKQAIQSAESEWKA
jgi:hypothetical protein